MIVLNLWSNLAHKCSPAYGKQERLPHGGPSFESSDDRWDDVSRSVFCKADPPSSPWLGL